MKHIRLRQKEHLSVLSLIQYGDKCANEPGAEHSHDFVTISTSLVSTVTRIFNIPQGPVLELLSIAAWFESATKQDKNRLQQTKKKITCAPLPTFQDLCTSRARRRARKIISPWTQPNYSSSSVMAGAAQLRLPKLPDSRTAYFHSPSRSLAADNWLLLLYSFAILLLILTHYTPTPGIVLDCT